MVVLYSGEASIDVSRVNIFVLYYVPLSLSNLICFSLLVKVRNAQHAQVYSR